MKIEAKDLRMGNYILDDEDTIVKVECLKSKEYNDWNGAEEDNILFSKSGELCWSSDTFGIPITPEILEKAGFEKRGNSNGIFIAYDINEIYRVYLEKGKYSLWILDRDYEEVSYCRLSDITNLHQLQNLYYCLCGQELNIEL